MPYVLSVDSDASRKTLSGIAGVYVVVEKLQPNLERYTKRQELSKEKLQTAIENQLKASGIRVLNKEEWLSTKGRPVLYVDINAHEYHKYALLTMSALNFNRCIAGDESAQRTCRQHGPHT